MVAASTASSDSERLSLDGPIRTLLAMPGVAVAAFFAAPVVAALAVLASADAGGRGDELTVVTWLAATAFSLATLAIAVKAARPGLERSMRVWLTGTFVCAAAWIFAAAATGLDRRLSPEPEDLLLVGSALCTVIVLRLFTSHRVSQVDGLAFCLDAGLLVMAILTMVVVVLGSHAEANASLYTVAYPSAFFAIAGVSILAVVAARLRIEPRGGFLLLPGVLLLGIAVAAWVDEWLTGPPVPILPAPPYALTLLLIAVGIASTGRDLEVRKGAARWAGPVQEAFPLAAVALAAVVLLMTGDQVSDVNVVRAVTALTVVCALAREAVLLRKRIVVLRELDRAEAATASALTRANAAETEQRLRADQLANVLRASERLALVGDGDVSFDEIVSAITPAGATSLLARLDPQTNGYLVVASWGPGVEQLAAMARPHGAAGMGGIPTAIGYYSASGRRINGVSVPFRDIGLPTSQLATLAIPLLDHAGQPLGALHLFDPLGERILDADFVALAQLVASQIAVALENQALVARVQAQLEEVQRVQSQLIQATKLGAIGELAAAVAHEVNNPLTGILGFSELLLTELSPDDPRHEEVAIIRGEAVRARAITRALVEFARPRPPQRAPTDVNALARETVDLVRYRAGEIGISVIEHYGEVPTTELDPGAIKQVLLNLLNNAVRAMPGGGVLAVSTSISGGRIALAVSDDGVGMDAETQERIFSPFFTAEGPGLGSGFGLPVCLQIVEGHDGTIEVRSAPGRGSTFTVSLPLAGTAAEPALGRGRSRSGPAQ